MGLFVCFLETTPLTAARIALGVDGISELKNNFWLFYRKGKLLLYTLVSCDWNRKSASYHMEEITYTYDPRYLQEQVSWDATACKHATSHRVKEER